jgi:hypothetical protein
MLGQKFSGFEKSASGRPNVIQKYDAGALRNTRTSAPDQLSTLQPLRTAK